MVSASLSRRLSVAPMMDRTDRHARFFLRLISRRTLLYTEMVTAMAVVHGDAERHLAFDARESPVALQLGSSDPKQLAYAASLAESFGYVEVNLNVGCPSDKVQTGRFGACLMAEPALVAECCAAMIAATPLPVTVKTRIGIDDRDSYEELVAFVDKVSAAGVSSFAIHARKAWLSGLSPKENREIPPLDYPRVHRLKQDFPHLEIAINGGVLTLDAARKHLRHLDGVMIGRAAYDDPYILARADRDVFGGDEIVPTRREIVDGLIVYAEELAQARVPFHRLGRHIHGLFAGQAGGRLWRRTLAEQGHKPGAGPDVLRAAVAQIPAAVLDARDDDAIRVDGAIRAAG
ncbi:MAG TPA: tRNA dihydrouridine(20/20a) synthase DusA [Alphaproteobacteria bacterium]|nr:tRNA dihydrouridine(20/20a) synthase DusA [Alphaproteobacteria bacterium]